MEISEIYQRFQQHPFIATDSRNCPENSLFFALKGDRFDGNDYIGAALENGAACAVGDREGLPSGGRIIRVDNALQTLQDLANYHRRQMKARIIALTGTNGKTTTKELIAAALSVRYKTLSTQGNLNNHIGVPLTLLRLKPEHEMAVIEMGASHPGEIRELCRIALPAYGLITNVGKAHLEGFGSFEGVVRTKTELYDFLREKNGTVFVNQDNRILAGYLHSLSSVCYGTLPGTFVRGKIRESFSCLNLEWEKEKGKKEKIKTRLAGNYNFENVLAAICVASWFEVEAGDINAAIENYIPQNNRSQNQKTDKNQLIIDSYNANPESMQAALENFISLKTSPKMAILGEMRELGKYSEEEHRKIVEILLRSDIGPVLLAGEEFAKLSGLPSGWKIFSQTAALAAYLATAEISGHTILIKGSRGNHLEKVVEYL
ncbi:MAG: UDP-N-acetylmuramoyl-tripeptide--D-alanyl-D-alanine ligase [Candidatus Symbiothrix sp.]|nr:UDP-N-acetylmuramoyl-tripeptide--D-alanyl-D-alanine ligase [Candidatus Symbiothrix sp.]